MVPAMRKLFSTGLAAALLALVLSAPAMASEASFYRDVQGRWTGPGQIVAGKFKGTRFTCDLNGLSPSSKTGLSIGGACRVGMFSQPINADVERAGRVYVGKFLDGEAGEGMDVIGGRYTGSKLIVDIRRKDLRGVMVAKLNSTNQLNITISVWLDTELIPVIGMTLQRSGDSSNVATTGSIRKQAAR